MYNFIRLQYIMNKITEDEVRILCKKYNLSEIDISNILNSK